jgi:aconitase A
MSLNSFNSRSTLKVGSKEYEIYRLDALDQQGISTKHLPFSLRILLAPAVVPVIVPPKLLSTVALVEANTAPSPEMLPELVTLIAPVLA